MKARRQREPGLLTKLAYNNRRRGLEEVLFSSYYTMPPKSARGAAPKARCFSTSCAICTEIARETWLQAPPSFLFFKSSRLRVNELETIPNPLRDAFHSRSRIVVKYPCDSTCLIRCGITC